MNGIVLVIDGQGGGVGRALVAEIKLRRPDTEVIAVGTNALATSAMLKAGADAGATGENAVTYNAARAEYILGPIGIVVANSLMGEVTPAMAGAVGASDAQKILVPVGRCRVTVAGTSGQPVADMISAAVDMLTVYLYE